MTLYVLISVPLFEGMSRGCLFCFWGKSCGGSGIKGFQNQPFPATFSVIRATNEVGLTLPAPSVGIVVDVDPSYLRMFPHIFCV